MEAIDKDVNKQELAFKITKSNIDEHTAELFQNLHDLDKFIATYGKDIDPSLQKEVLISTHMKVLHLLKDVLQLYSHALLSTLSHEEPEPATAIHPTTKPDKKVAKSTAPTPFTTSTAQSFSPFSQTTQIAAAMTLSNQIFTESIGTKDSLIYLEQSVTNHSNLFLMEIHDIFIDVVNSWMLFYLKYLWEFIELGINEFSTFRKFVLWDYETTGAKKVHRKERVLREVLSEFVAVAVERVGRAVFEVAEAERYGLKSSVKKLHERLEAISFRNSLISSYLLSQFRFENQQDYKRLVQSRYYLKVADSNLLEAFSRNIFDNMDNPPVLDYTTTLPSEEEEASSSFRPVIGLLTNTSLIAKLLSLESDGGGEGAGGMEMDQRQVSLSPQIGAKDALTPANAKVRDGGNAGVKSRLTSGFLQAHPAINNRRVERNIQNLNRAAEKVVEEFKIVVSEEGNLGKWVKFKGEEKWTLVTKDEEGNAVVSANPQNSRWTKIEDPSEITRNQSMQAISVLRKVDLTSSIGTLTEQSVSKMAIDAGSGVVGDTLYKLARGKEPLKQIGKEFVVGTGKSLAINFLIGSSPELAIALASTVGIKALYDLKKNPLIKPETKALLITDIIARTGARIGLTVGSAIIGQVLIPVPVLGSFVGGVIGSFGVNALFDGYEQFVASRVSMEVFVIYILMQFGHFGVWNDVPLTKHQILESRELLHRWLNSLSFYFSMNTDEDSLILDMNNKSKRIHGMMDRLYAEIMNTGGKDSGHTGHRIGDNQYRIRWKTMIGIGVIIYYKCMLMKELDRLVQIDRMSDDDRVEVIDLIDQGDECTIPIEYLVQEGCEWTGEDRILEKVCLGVNRLIADKDIVTLFMQEGKSTRPPV